MTEPRLPEDDQAWYQKVLTATVVCGALLVLNAVLIISAVANRSSGLFAVASVVSVIIVVLGVRIVWRDNKMGRSMDNEDDAP